MGRPPCRLGAAGVGAGGSSGEELAGAVGEPHVLEALPLGREHEQSLAAGSTEHAGEGPAIEVHRPQHLTTLADPYAAPARYVGVPDGSVGIEADPVRMPVPEVGPDPPVR